MEKIIPNEDELEKAILEQSTVAYLDRISRARRRLENVVSHAHGLTPLQLQILIFLRHSPRLSVSVSFLADELEVSEATMSDSLRSLEQKNFVEKVASAHDRRVRELMISAEGANLADECEQELRLPLETLPTADLKALSRILHTWVAELFRRGTLHHARICQTCIYFSPAGPGEIGRCDLLKAQLTPASLKSDCPEHVYRKVG
ncbi:MAG: hypothetical protein OHK0011_19720 [Turneriella sp.]